MKKLIKGITTFRKTLTDKKRQAFAKLALGQRPDCLFIGCSDSRVAPNHFASTDPGDLFVVRNVGNLIPPSTHEKEENGATAALEFAVTHLNVTDIVICGHSECGAMQAIEKGIETLSCPHLKNWLTLGKGAIKRIHQEGAIDPKLSSCNQISQMNVLVQIEHVLSHNFVKERVDKKQLTVHGWWFNISTADVFSYDLKEKKFLDIKDYP